MTDAAARDAPVPEVLPHRYALVGVDEISPHPENPNTGDVVGIAGSIEAAGFWGVLLIHEATGHILSGEHRWRAARKTGMAELPAIVIDTDEDTARAILLGENEWARRGVWDQAKLVALLQRQAATAQGLAATGFTEARLAALISGARERQPPRPALADRFLVPPFDVLDARAGWWRDRKKAWLALGLASELGRLAGDAQEGAAMRGGTAGWLRADPGFYRKKEHAEEALGRALTTTEFVRDWYDKPSTGVGSGISIFDPVLCELVYRWFSAEGWHVLDPCAGGSVRGLVAGALGRGYSGCDLSAPQVAANAEAAEDWHGRGLLDLVPMWTADDGRKWAAGLPEHSFDLMLTCPPYYDLERYSDDPADLSAMSPGDFNASWTDMLADCGRALRPDRFAVIVTGDTRGRGGGAVRDLRGVTIRAAGAAGLEYCNGAVLLTPIGSVPYAAARLFTGTRGLGRCHQDVLVFCKGDRGAAAQALGEVAVELPPGLADA